METIQLQDSVLVNTYFSLLLFFSFFVFSLPVDWFLSDFRFPVILLVFFRVKNVTRIWSQKGIS